MSQPLAYYQTNVVKTLQLCRFLIEAGCPRLVVESSAAVYGDSAVPVVDEATPTAPASPYAYSKAALERMLRDISAAHALQVVCFRLFNVVGSGNHRRRPRSSTDVLSQLRNAIEQGGEFVIHGGDWPTIDGTPLRDFVHVNDVVRAHLSLITRPDWRSGERFEVLNLSTGVGTTVRQLAQLYMSLSSAPVRIRVSARRPGDIAGFVGDSSRARALLGWSPQSTLSDVLRTEQQAGRDASTNADVLDVPDRSSRGKKTQCAPVVHNLD